MTAIRATMGPVEWGLLLLLSVLWGGSFFFTEIALTALPPFTVVWLRVALAAAVLWALVAARGLAVPRDGRTWTALAVMGLLNNALPFSLIVWGQTAISGSLAAILNAATPVWTVLLAHWLTRDERLAPHRLAGVVLGLGGVVVLVGPEALAGLAGGMSDGTGTAQLAVVAATVSYALAGIWGRRFAALPPLVTAGGQVTASAVLLLPAVVLVDRPWTLPCPARRPWPPWWPSPCSAPRSPISSTSASWPGPGPPTCCW